MEFREGELSFEFGDAWSAEQFDSAGARWPKGISPVDFIAERDGEMVLIEVKDPSASRAPESEREKFSRKMQTKELTHQELVPKARSSYSFLHLMKRDTSPMRLVVVIGTERLSIQPPLLMNLTDRLRKRLGKEIDKPWKRKFIVDCAVIPVTDLGKVLPGCSARRIDPTMS